MVSALQAKGVALRDAYPWLPFNLLENHVRATLASMASGFSTASASCCGTLHTFGKCMSLRETEALP